MTPPRLLLAAFAALFAGCQASDTSAPSQYVFYVGTSGPKAQGILRCELDGKTGKIAPPVVVAEAKSASYIALSPDAKFLYATAEAAEGAVAAYSLEGGKARLLNMESSKGKGPTHLAVDAKRSNLIVVNYGSGSTTNLPIKDDGSLAASTSSLQHVGSGPNTSRQAGPHAHGVYFHPNNGRVYVTDLGTDDIFIYQVHAQTGILVPNNPKSGRVASGAGPRHLAFHPSGQFAYVNNEMALTVTAFSVGSNGGLKELQTLDALPLGADKKGASTAEIFVHPNGKTLYVSNRGHNSIAVYSIAQDGRLSLLQHVLETPATPRGFGLSADGRWLVCAGQKSGTLNAYQIGLDGRLTDTHQSVEAPAAAAVVFVP